MNQFKKMLSAYMVAHFAVDFACAFLFFRFFHTSDNLLFYLLLYNFCAFALQMPIGLLADKWNKNAICAMVGGLLIIFSYIIKPYEILAVIIAGVGNAMFHIGGGIDVLNESTDKPTLLGLFVSPGAIGIYLGTLLGGGNKVQEWLPIILLILIILAIGVATYADRHSFHSNNSPVFFPDTVTANLLLAMGCFFIVVCFRSYIGMVVQFPWKSIKILGILSVICVVFGKAAGGYIADKIGITKASYLSLGVGAICFLLFDIPFLGLLGLLLFNMTMPITLWSLAKLLPGCKGFSFGILTFGLFIGFIPVYLDMPFIISNRFGYGLATLASLFLLIVGLKKGRIGIENG